MIKIRYGFMMALVGWVAVILMSGVGLSYPGSLSNRTITVHYSLTVTLSEKNGSGPLAVWIPVPDSDPWQKVTDMQVKTAGSFRLTRDRQYGNRIVFISMERAEQTTIAQVEFTVHRREPVVLMNERVNRLRMSPSGDDNFDLFLKPNQRVPVGGQWAKLAREIIGDARAPIEKVKAIYRHIVDSFRYDYRHESPRRGEGDVPFVCDFRKGNCLDLHSYGVTLLRSLGFPAYVESGLPLSGIPLDGPLPESGSIDGYHCWTWVYIHGYGWVPYDASDARRWLDADFAEARDYLFGNLLLERSAVAYSRGRDIILEPKQKGEPLNTFNHPYAEAQGKPVKVEWSIRYRILKRPPLRRWTVRRIRTR